MLFKHLCSKEENLNNYWSISIVPIWYSRRYDCNIHLIKTHCCSNVSIDRIELTALFSIRDLTHWAAWGDLLFIWKHKDSLPAGGNCFVLCNSTGAICSVLFNGVKTRGCICGLKTVILFSWCYTWVDVIFIWGVVLVLIGRNIFIIKLIWDGCSCRIICRWCMISWI